MWKPEYAANRRAKYQSDEAEREKRKAQGRTPEENVEYMRAYYIANKPKYRKTPEQQAKHNAARREKYRTDAEYRERHKLEVRSRDKDLVRDGKLRGSFGISAADYDVILASQGGGCAICGRIGGDGCIDKRTRKERRLHVDHCHKSGKVRGILCSHCNRGLGTFRDDPELLIKAAMYLRSRVGEEGPDQ